MPRPYSSDLRERALHALETSALKREEIAAPYQICPATLYNWQKQRKQERRTTPEPHGGGPARHFDLEALWRIHQEQTDHTLAEFQVRYQEETGNSISYSSVRLLRALLGMTRKKRRCGPASKGERSRCASEPPFERRSSC